MKRLVLTAVVLAAVATTARAQARRAAPAALPAPTAPKFVEVQPKDSPFVVYRVNGMIASLRNARPADVVATFFPMHPVVGRDRLPDDRRFDVDVNPYETSPGAVLAGLGNALGVSIRDAETTAEFLIVRNETNPTPKGWVRVTEGDLFDFGLLAKGPRGITRVDPTDGYHTAYFVTMPEFAHFLNDSAPKPVWNQTALLGHHCFSFRLHGGNVNRTLGDMGFDVVTRAGTTRCVVVGK